MTMPMAMAQRADTGFAQRPYIRGEEKTWANGKPPHVFAPDGSWISTIAGVNADGSFMGGRDPSTGLYWPGDAWVGNRPAYFDDLSRPPYMDPDGIVGKRESFSGIGLTLESAPASAPVVVETPKIFIPTIIAGDDGSRLATMSPGEEIRRAQQTPTARFAPIIPAPLPVKWEKDPAGTYLIDGTLKQGDKVLNVDRTLEETLATNNPPAGGTGPGGAQELPTNNTTAAGVPVDWKKYLPYALGLIVLVLLIVAMRRRQS